MPDAHVERRVAALAADMVGLRQQLDVFGDLAKLLATAETRVAAAEAARNESERRAREAERREAEAIAAMAEMEGEVERAIEGLDKKFYRRGYDAGYKRGRLGAPASEDPTPRLRALA